MYTGPYFDFVDEHRDYGLTALVKLREHVQQGLERQGSFCDASSWDLPYLKTPKQPGSAGCGVCVLIIIELMVTRGVEAFYQLNEQCEDQEPAARCLKTQLRFPGEKSSVMGGWLGSAAIP